MRKADAKLSVVAICINCCLGTDCVIPECSAKSEQVNRSKESLKRLDVTCPNPKLVVL